MIKVNYSIKIILKYITAKHADFFFLEEKKNRWPFFILPHPSSLMTIFLPIQIIKTWLNSYFILKDSLDHLNSECLTVFSLLLHLHAIMVTNFNCEFYVSFWRGFVDYSNIYTIKLWINSLYSRMFMSLIQSDKSLIRTTTIKTGLSGQEGALSRRIRSYII